MDLNMQKNVAENLKQFRSIFGYTQAEIAEELHICRSTYTMYELGKKTPSTETLIDLASIYDIRLDVLLDRHTNTYIQKIFSQSRTRENLFQLIQTYYKLPPMAQGQLLERAKVLLETEETLQLSTAPDTMNHKQRL